VKNTSDRSSMFFSSGGLGDAYITMLKIIEQAEHPIKWWHGTGHDIHLEPITELMTILPGVVEAKCCKITKETVKQLEKEKIDLGAVRLNTKVSELTFPTPNLEFVHPYIEKTDRDYVVLQPVAGRPDNSLRSFSPGAILTLVDFFCEKYDVVLLGMKYDLSSNKIVNLTGETSVRTALGIVKGAKHFIGFDGFLAYVAMSMIVPSTVLFHDARLPSHYMHDGWKERTKAHITPQRINDVGFMLKGLSC